MADLIRQLRNDEKRCNFAMVGTLAGESVEFPTTTDATPMYVIPKNACVTRVYAVVTEAFAIGSVLDYVSIYDGTSAPLDLFTAVPLDVVGAVTLSAETDSIGRVETDQSVSTTVNQLAIDSVIGEVKIVVEFTEEPVKMGSYTR